MVLYNVTIKVELGIVEAWVEWMKQIHMPDLMATGLFIDCKLYQIMDLDESEGVTFSAQYFCKNLDDYNNYISAFAVLMREKAFQKFGSKFVAFRTVMEQV